MKTPKKLYRKIIHYFCIPFITLLLSSLTSFSQSNSEENLKIRLMYDSPTGYHRQILIGTNKYATNGYDFGYDAPIADIAKEDMFWCLGEDKLVIQGVQNFDIDQEFKLGLIVSELGLVRIKIDQLENLDNSTDLYIKDSVTNKTHQINDICFEINLEPGEYLNRFSLVFKPIVEEVEALAVELNKNLIVYMDNISDELMVKSALNAKVNSINVFNYAGQLIASRGKLLTHNEISIPLQHVTSGVYLIQIQTENNAVVKKVIVQ